MNRKNFFFLGVICLLFIWSGPASAQSWVWDELSPSTVPSARSGHAGAVVGKFLYIFGGNTGTGYNGDLYRMDLTVPEWYLVIPATLKNPSARYNHTLVAATVDGESGLLLFSGFDGRMLNDMWFYNISANTWTEIEHQIGSYPPGIMGHYAGVDSVGNMVVFGGSTDAGYINDIYVYSPAPVNSWAKLSPSGTLPEFRYEHAGCINSSLPDFKLWIHAGKDHLDHFDDTWVYNKATNAWTELITTGDIPGQRASHTAAYIESDNNIIIFGGESPACKNDTYILNLGTNAWTQITPVSAPSDRYDHVSVWDASSIPYPRMITHGGECSPSFRSDTWELAFRMATPTPGGSPTSTPEPSPTPVVLCAIRYPSDFIDLGNAINETQAYMCDDIPAVIPAGNEELHLSGFSPAYVGDIYFVRAYVKYRTSAAPVTDSYRFEVSLDGSFVLPVSVVPETFTHQPVYRTVGIDLGPISYADIGKMVIREKGRLGASVPDSYTVEWDCAYIEIYGECIVATPSPTPEYTKVPTLTYTYTATPTATPTILFTVTSTPTGTWFSTTPTDTFTPTTPSGTPTPTVSLVIPYENPLSLTCLAVLLTFFMTCVVYRKLMR